MEYMYIITLNNRKCQNTSKCLLQKGTERKKTSSHILDPSKAFGLSRTIFLSRTMGKGGGRNFRLCPLLGPHDILTGPNWHNAQLDHIFYKIRQLLCLSGTIYYIRFFIFLIKSPCGAPGGPVQNCTCTTRPWDQ